jgi:hypothetical protein
MAQDSAPKPPRVKIPVDAMRSFARSAPVSQFVLWILGESPRNSKSVIGAQNLEAALYPMPTPGVFELDAKRFSF